MEAERVGGIAFAQVLTDMRDTQKELVARLDELIEGFPNRDIDGHRRYHEAVIERMELRNALVRAALIKVAQAGGVTAAGWIAVALWQSFKISVRQ